MEFNKMIHNMIERIKIILINGLYKIPRRKKIIICRNGRCIVRFYCPDEIKPCIKEEYKTNRCISRDLNYLLLVTSSGF